MSVAKRWLLGVGVFHIVLMGAELYPSTPYVMSTVAEKWHLAGKLDKAFDSQQQTFVETVVRNVAIYNGIVGFALIVSTLPVPPPKSMQVTLLLGVIVAGAVGGMTLTWLTWFQALAGLGALIVVLRQPDGSAAL
jgi:uncharacterized membrane protein